MSQESRASTPFMSPTASPPASPTASPPPPADVTVLALTTATKDEQADDRYVSTDIQWHAQNPGFHIELKNHAKEQWPQSQYTPSNEDRCNLGSCQGCKSGSCLSDNSKYAAVLAKDGIACLGCDQKRACCVREPCTAWAPHPHLAQNWKKAVYELNSSLKKKYTAGQLVQIEGDEAWFVYTNTTLSTPSRTHGGGGGGGATHADEIDTGALASAIHQLNANMHKIDKNVGVIAQECRTLTTQQQSFADQQKSFAVQQQSLSDQQQSLSDQQQQQGRTIASLCLQVEQQQKQCDDLKTDFLSWKREEFRIPPITPFQKEPHVDKKEGSRSLTDDPIDRLASVLQKSLGETKPSVRLPQFSLPRITLQGGEMDAATYHLWKSKCTALFDEHSLPESLCVSMMQSEQTLPPRYKQQITSAITIDGVWAILDTMFAPVASLKPRLLRDLTSLPNAYTTEEQIATHDQILVKLNQIGQFFAGADIDIPQLTAVLATFAGPENLASMPDTIARFESKHDTSGRSYISLLRDHCQKRRGDLYQVLTSLDLYRSHQSTAHNNITVEKETFCEENSETFCEENSDTEY